MKTRKLGKNGPTVSAVGLGCMGFTQSYPPYPNREDAICTIRESVDLGVTFFDTAEVYSYGMNEDLVGEALQPVRDKVILATKFGYDLSEKPDLRTSVRPVALSSRPETIRKAVEGSLRRLRTRPYRPLLPASCGQKCAYRNSSRNSRKINKRRQSIVLGIIGSGACNSSPSSCRLPIGSRSERILYVVQKTGTGTDADS